MIKRFEEGKYYRYTGNDARLGWSDSGKMHQVLDGRPRKCVKGNGYHSVLEGLGDYTWSWYGDLEYFEEVTMATEFVKGKYYKYTGKSVPSGWDWVENMRKVLDGRTVQCVTGGENCAEFAGIGSYHWADGKEYWIEVSEPTQFKFEVGKTYRYNGKTREHGWNYLGKMDAVLDGKPRVCKTVMTYHCAGFDNVPEGSVGDWWCWVEGLENWEEVEAVAETTDAPAFKFGSRVWVRNNLHSDWTVRFYVGRMDDRSKKFVTVDSEKALKAYGGDDVLVTRCYKYATDVSPNIVRPFRKPEEVLEALGKKVRYHGDVRYFSLTKTGIKIGDLFLTFAVAFKTVTFEDGTKFGKEEN